LWEVIYEWAAVAGLDPGPLTLGELVHAAQFRMDFEWSQTAALMALTANCHRDPKKRAYRPEDFYKPQLHQRKKHKGGMSLDKLYALRGVFTKRG
jgi:hypothetical protein